MDADKIKVVFLGSKEIGSECLEILLDVGREAGINIIGVLTNDRILFPESRKVSDIAAENGIPVLDSLDEYLALDNVDVTISVQYHLLLKRVHIEKAARIAVNYHMAPLPEYRGCNQFSFAILDEADEFGTTVHVMDESIDGGAVIAERRFSIAKEWDVWDLYKRTYDETVALFKESIMSILHGDISPISQKDLAQDRPVSIHYREEMAGLRKIDLEWAPEKIIRHVRAVSMPGCAPPYAEYKGRIVQLVLERESE